MTDDCPLDPGPSSFILHPSSFPAHPFPIAGFRHYDGARELPALREGGRLTLRPEPGNPHDMHAVEILHGPAKLGYVPRFCNRHISHLLAEGVPVTCEIERVDPNSPPWEAVAVRLSVADTTIDSEAA
jgi:hypothetical protein